MGAAIAVEDPDLGKILGAAAGKDPDLGKILGTNAAAERPGPG